MDWGAWPAASDLSAAFRPRVAGLASRGRGGLPAGSLVVAEVVVAEAPMVMGGAATAG